jgi:hypothetical protein
MLVYIALDLCPGALNERLSKEHDPDVGSLGGSNILSDILEPFVHLGLAWPYDTVEVGASFDASIHDRTNLAIGLALLDRHSDGLRDDDILPHNLAQFDVVARIYGPGSFSLCRSFGRIPIDSQSIARVTSQKPFDVLVLDEDLEMGNPVGPLDA